MVETSFKTYAVISAIIILLALIFYYLGRKRAALPYIKAENLLTKNERDCYRILRAYAEKRGYDIFCKVRFADIVNVKKGAKDYIKWFNKIKSKHIDFVICKGFETDPILLVELDDRSHLKEERVERDNFVNEVCAVCGIDIAHIYRKDFGRLENILDDVLM